MREKKTKENHVYCTQSTKRIVPASSQRFLSSPSAPFKTKKIRRFPYYAFHRREASHAVAHKVGVFFGSNEAKSPSISLRAFRFRPNTAR
jgi:hypothetical protein